MNENRKPLSLHRLRAMHAQGEKIAMLTCYDSSFARLLDDAGIDVLLIGDSLGMVLQGRDSTLPVTLQEMAYHTACVARGRRSAWLIADLPFGSYQQGMAQAIESEGFEVLGVTSYGDLSQFAQQQSRASAFILSIDDEEFTPGPDLDPAVLNLRQFIEEVRRKNLDVPIYVYGETKTSRHIPNDILRELHGFIHMFEDTPEFVARHIIREAKSYLEGVQPPFFKALLDYAEDGSYSWHCPGHSGGVAFLKSPVGQMFHQFFGENMQCGRGTRPAARPYRADRSFRTECRTHLQRRPLLLRDQRHQHLEQDRVAPLRGAR